LRPWQAGPEGARGSTISRGGQGGHYINKASSVELTVPPGWNLTDGPSSDNGDMAEKIQI